MGRQRPSWRAGRLRVGMSYAARWPTSRCAAGLPARQPDVELRLGIPFRRSCSSSCWAGGSDVAVVVRPPTSTRTSAGARCSGAPGRRGPEARRSAAGSWGPVGVCSPLGSHTRATIERGCWRSAHRWMWCPSPTTLSAAIDGPSGLGWTCLPRPSPRPGAVVRRRRGSAGAHHPRLVRRPPLRPGRTPGRQSAWSSPGA